MKSSGSKTFLTELVVVILFFSLAAVISLQIFSYANEKSTESKKINKAVVYLQDTAELFYSGGLELLEDSGSWINENGNYRNDTEENIYILFTYDGKVSETETGWVEAGTIKVIEKIDGNEDIICDTTVKRYVRMDPEVAQ